MHFNGQTLSGVLNSFLLGLEMQNTIFKEKMVLRVVFINLTLRWLPTGQFDLKNTKQMKISYDRFVTHF